VADSKQQLKKELGLLNIIAMAAGGMIAAWMVEITLWFDLSGPGSLVALITCGVLVLSLCLIYSEMTSMLPYAGGENIWISNAFGWEAGWYGCWLVMLLYIMAMPVVSFGISSMLRYLYPITFIQEKVIASVTLLVWYFLTNKEIKILAKLQSTMFWGTLIVSVGASLSFIFSSEWHFETLKPFFPNGVNGYGAAVGLLIMKFVGFDLVPQLSEESNFPKRKMWMAYAGSMGLTILVYGLAVLAVGGIFTSEQIKGMDIVDPRAADVIGHHWLGILIVVMGIFTCLTTLSSFWLCASRTLYGAAQQHQFTEVLARLNVNAQPQNANIVVGIFSLYFTVFAPEKWINYIYTIYGFAAGLVYMLVVLSFLRLRKTHPEWKRSYKLPFAGFFGLVGFLFTVYVLVVSCISMDKGAWITLVIYLLIGIPFLFYARSKQKTDPEKWRRIVINPDNTPVED
jgi:APA family basic amino acid/polyamine antiporter